MWSALAVIAALLAALVGSPAGASTAPKRKAPIDGPFAVGRRTETFVDASRPTQKNGTYPGAPTRTLPVMVLYPAQGDPSSTVDTGNAPAARGRFPLIVFSHGFTATGPDYEPLLRNWAAAGYVIAAPTFPLSNGRAPGGPYLGDYVNQPGDVSFVITKILQLDRTTGSGLRHLISRDRIAAAGHSLGAITTLGVTYNSCCRDPRIDAAVSLAGIQLPFPKGAWFAGHKAHATPLLLVHGDHDRTVPYPASVATFAAASAPKFFETLVGAPHTPFRPPWLEPVVKSVTDFFDRYVKHAPGSLSKLSTDAGVPGVTTFQAQPEPTP